MTRSVLPRGRSVRVLAMGDVGHATAYHVGDEAMLVAVQRELAAAGASVEWGVVSAEPQVSERLLGFAAVPRFGFASCGTDIERRALLASIGAALARPGDDWVEAAPANCHATLRAVRSSDAVLLTGGGNLCSTWPEHVFERLALAHAATRAGIPIAITGQTIGPELGGLRTLVADLLGRCTFVGTRESASHALARDLGVPSDRLLLQFDDAIGLEATRPAFAPPRSPWIAVTVNPFGASDVSALRRRALAQALAHASRRTGVRVVFVPHVGRLDGKLAHDEVEAREIVMAADWAVPPVYAPLPTPEEAMWLAREAALVVSTRYHPVVFATAGAVPVVFIWQDEYTRTKGQGALALVGQERWSLDIDECAAGLAPMIEGLWNEREEVRRHLAARRSDIAASRRHHVARLIDALRATGHRAPSPVSGITIPRD